MNFSSVPARDFISRPSFRDPAPALWTGLCYYLGAQLASMLASAPIPMPNLRPGGAILLAALLATPPRCWLSILLAVLPVHLFVYAGHAVPLETALSWFAGNCTQAILGASGAARILRRTLRLDLLRHAIVFVAWCAFVAPAVGTLLEVAMLRVADAHPGTFWQAWTARVVPAAAAILVLVPLRIHPPPLRRLAELTQARALEAALLALALVVAGTTLLLGRPIPSAFVPLAAYLPLPLLLWTAIRFGPFSAGFAFLLFSMFAVIGTASGNGPFADDAREGAGLFLPLFLAGVAVPLLLLSAAIQERRGTLAALQQEQGKLGQALAAERKRGEAEIRRQGEQLAHLSRVVVLGELSGALAHELNQPLAAILSNAQAARRFLANPGADPGEIREILDDIVDEDKRAAEVIRRLRALFKHGEPVLRPVEVNDLVRGALGLTHGNLVERGVSVRLDLQDGLAVRGDPVQLQQVLLNLIVNACDAMRATATARRQLCLRAQALPGGLVQVSVADTGPGIAPGLAGRIFEPFFTTKAEGLGFGLSISRAIINQHGGQLEAANDPAGGSVFRITLPRHSGGNNV